MIQRILQAALDGEMNEHIKEDRPNRRNGHTDKQVQTSMGPVELEPPRDRNSSFEPNVSACSISYRFISTFNWSIFSRQS